MRDEEAEKRPKLPKTLTKEPEPKITPKPISPADQFIHQRENASFQKAPIKINDQRASEMRDEGAEERPKLP